MGACASTAPVRDDVDIGDWKSFLVLGPQYAGKTSLIRHLQLSRGEFTTIERRAALAHTLQATAISFVHALVEFLRDYNHCYPNTLDSVALDLMERIRTDRDSLNEEDVEAITALWQFEFFGDLLDSAGFYIHSSNLAYVIDALPRILTADYLPTDSDLLRLHYRTAGIIPYRLSGIPADPHHAQTRSSSSTKKHASTANKGMDFLSDARIVETASMNVRLIDVGGARHERLKWGSQFIDAHKQGKVPATITAILFVVALDSVFTKTEEDSNVNGMMDSLDLFKLVCNEPSIADVPKILILNKLDAFEIHFNKEVAKFRGVFPDYTGEISAVGAAGFVASKFTALSRNEVRVAIDSCTRTNFRQSQVRSVFERFCKQIG